MTQWFPAAKANWFRFIILGRVHLILSANCDCEFFLQPMPNPDKQPQGANLNRGGAGAAVNAAIVISAVSFALGASALYEYHQLKSRTDHLESRIGRTTNNASRMHSRLNEVEAMGYRIDELEAMRSRMEAIEARLSTLEQSARADKPKQ
jgi:hypothetical protein